MNTQDTGVYSNITRIVTEKRNRVSKNGLTLKFTRIHRLIGGEEYTNSAGNFK